MPCLSTGPPRPKNKKCRPSGSIVGQRCDVCAIDASSLVSSDAVPPDDATRIKGVNVFGAKIIVPSGAQAPPRVSVLASASDCAGPPDASILRNLPPAKNPIALLSGDQNGKAAPFVPGSCLASTDVSGRTHSEVSPEASLDTKTT